MGFANAASCFLRRRGTRMSHSFNCCYNHHHQHHFLATTLQQRPAITNSLAYNQYCFFQHQLWLSRRRLRTTECNPAQKSVVLDERSRGSGRIQRIVQVQKKIGTIKEVVIPLCERTETHAVSLKELLLWRKCAQALAVSVASRFCDLDGGPTGKELLRELDWYLDDAIAKCNPIMVCEAAGFQQIEHQELNSWRELKAWLSISDFEEFQLDEEATSGLECDDKIFSDSAKTSADAALFTREMPKAHVLLRTSMESLIENWQERIHKRRPFQYVVGCAHWRDLVLSVQEGVLIPRPETEQMIDLASAAISEHEFLKRGVWADLGTGSGAIAIGLARLLEADGLVFAVDASEIAVAVATQNVRRYGLQVI
ncbi:hypothetical protein O6H91_03G064800 [Diphasiastrum complanatum]|uniref:Uncharacterized protein n=1 Tax=Diphasiastrum complanatum TaxID=34168 RepID=A0ACC2E753_DIPCM|nr:hypothetical protein O6H91_03G064800 [Diphasiastrum complanatum]